MAYCITKFVFITQNIDRRKPAKRKGKQLKTKFENYAKNVIDVFNNEIIRVAPQNKYAIQRNELIKVSLNVDIDINNIKSLILEAIKLQHKTNIAAFTKKDIFVVPIEDVYLNNGSFALKLPEVVINGKTKKVDNYTIRQYKKVVKTINELNIL